MEDLMHSIVNLIALVSVISLAMTGSLAQAQSIPAASPVAFTHVHLTVKDIAATKTLWVDGLGGSAMTVGTTEAVTFPGLLVLLHQGEPKSGTKDTTISFIGLEVKNLAATVDALKAAKVKMVTREQTNMVYTVTDDIATIPDQQTVSAVAQTPEKVRVRLVENTQAAVPVSFSYLHLTPPVLKEAVDWYAKALGATVGDRGFGFQSLDLGKQKSALLFTLASDTIVGTEGRALGRIGFEVRDADRLAKAIQAMGGKIMQPFAKSAETGSASVVVSDPWGTLIELSEGLKR
jgi:catechol-2,3-dioxygenase